MIVDVLGKAEATRSSDDSFKAMVASKEGVTTEEDLPAQTGKEEIAMLDDQDKQEAKETEEAVDDRYNIKNFSL